MWHASVAAQGRFFAPGVREKLAQLALEGVGDASRGEWVEHTPRAVHVRRRLSAAEDLLVGPVVDVRGTPEAHSRFKAACAVNPYVAYMGVV